MSSEEQSIGVVAPRSGAPLVLPSGRSVAVGLIGGQEQLQILAPDGQVELQIVLTENGPLVRLAAARLEVQAADAIALSCKHFAVQSESAEIHTTGSLRMTGEEMRVVTRGDIHMNGDVIRLNCDPEPESSAATKALSASGCGHAHAAGSHCGH